MQTIFAWILAGFIIVAGYPWAAWLLGKNPRINGRLLTFLVGFAFSLAALTLLMFWEAALGIPLNFSVITLPYIAFILVGVALWSKQAPISPACVLPKSWPLRIAVAILFLVGLGILFNAVYWPFSRDDVLGIYGRYGRLMWMTGTLVSFERDDFFYQTYPIFVPLVYAYTYFASGWQNEYLARLFPALLSLACIPSGYLLGQMMVSRLAGWLSALFLALTPLFGRWASSGYVDLPMAFFYTLSAIFAWRLWHTRHWTDALLAGLMMGLAAWTKNAALLGIALLAGWLLWSWVKQRVTLRLVVLTLSTCTAVAAPWYIRNLVMAGMIIPPTVWLDQAQQSLDNLLVLITHPENFGLTGWMIALGLASSVAVILKQRATLEQAFLFVWTAPFFVAWWLFVSYDPRFLLLFLPLVSVLAGIWTARFWQLVPIMWQKRLLLPLGILGLAMALFIVWSSIEYKDELLQNPLMSDEAKHAIVLENR